MIPESLKKSYSLLEGKNLYIKNITQFSMDPMFKYYKHKQEYSKFLDELVSKSKKKLGILVQKYLKDFIMENVVLVSKQSPFYYGFTDNLIVAFVNTNTGYQDQLQQIAGSVVVYSVIHGIKDKNLVRYITPAVNIYSKLLLKCSSRPVDIDELYPDVGRILSAWFLKMFGQLSLKNLNIVLSNNDISFVSAEDTMGLIKKMETIQNASQVLTLVAEEIHTNFPMLKQTFSIRYSVDFFLGIENLYHFLYMLTISQYFIFPDQLYYQIKNLHDKRVPTLTKNIYQNTVKYIKS